MSAGCLPCQKCKDASRRLKTCGGRIAVFVFTTFVPLFPFGKGCAAVDDDRGAWCLPFRWLKARRPFLLPSSVASHPAAPVETPRPIVRLSARPLHRYARAGWVSTSQQSLWAATASPLLPLFCFRTQAEGRFEQRALCFVEGRGCPCEAWRRQDAPARCPAD